MSVKLCIFSVTEQYEANSEKKHLVASKLETTQDNNKFSLEYFDDPMSSFSTVKQIVTITSYISYANQKPLKIRPMRSIRDPRRSEITPIQKAI